MPALTPDNGHSSARRRRSLSATNGTLQRIKKDRHPITSSAAASMVSVMPETLADDACARPLLRGIPLALDSQELSQSTNPLSFSRPVRLSNKTCRQIRPSSGTEQD